MEMLGQESRKAFTNLTVKGKKSFRSWFLALCDGDGAAFVVFCWG